MLFTYRWIWPGSPQFTLSLFVMGLPATRLGCGIRSPSRLISISLLAVRMCPKVRFRKPPDELGFGVRAGGQGSLGRTTTVPSVFVMLHRPTCDRLGVS